MMAAAAYLGAKMQREAAPAQYQDKLDEGQPTVIVHSEGGEWMVEIDDHRGEMVEYTGDEAIEVWEESDQG